jgi:RNA-directed DNA polymerase
MLATLEEGVKGGKWYSLYDKVYRKGNLEAGYAKVKANGGKPGIDRVTVEAYGRNKGNNLEWLASELASDKYLPMANLRVEIPKPGSTEKRQLGIPTIKDRVAETALKNVIEPVFENTFAKRSYGFRPETGCKVALTEMNGWMKKGYMQVVEVDFRKYFDSVPRKPLMKKIAGEIADGRILSLIESYLKQGVMQDMSEWTPEKGTPQGAVISPLLGNIYLNDLDWKMERAGYIMIRYADDFVVLCQTAEEAGRALESVKEWTKEAELQLHEDKTRIVDMNQPGNSFEFLGFHFERSRRTNELSRWPRESSMTKLKEKIRQITPRCNGQSMSALAAKLNPILRGWFCYFRSSNENTFNMLDGWIRMRLRSILRKRAGKRGRGRGYDQQRWPNVYFRELGLFSTHAAQAAYCQSVKR